MVYLEEIEDYDYIYSYEQALFSLSLLIFYWVLKSNMTVLWNSLVFC